MTVMRDVGGTWSVSLAKFDLPLKRGTRLMVEPKGLTCRLLDWQYRIPNLQEGESELRADLELIVEELKPERASLWETLYGRLPDDWQGMLPMITAVAIGFFLAATVYTVRQEPEAAWAFAGRHVRWLVGWTVFLLFAAFLPVKWGLTRKPNTFRKKFLHAFLILTGYALVVVWLLFAARPDGFTYTNAEQAGYAKMLANKLSTSYWPLLVAALPWLSVGFKLFGMDLADKTAEGLEKATGKDKG